MDNSQIASWQERFGWFWYGGDTVFRWEDKDFDRAAKNFYDTGITTVILFGAHFRFSYWAYWNDIEDTIARITKAFHAYGIKVVEHHSSHLTFRIEDDDTWDLVVKAKRIWVEGFKDFRETSQANPVLGGSHMDDFGQIDGSTGRIAISSYILTEGKDVEWVMRDYIGNAHCFNHPSYYKAYTEHLERIIKKSHIDGIMNDDVQWFGGGNTCTCKYCRELFYRETGYRLPEPENWSSFYENYEDPAYIAWKRFKKKNSGDFHRRLDEFYRKLDFHPLRPAYCAEIYPMDTTCYGFESASELWDYIFQECCGIVKYSYLCFAIEAVHRYALAQRKGVPSMALLYPATQDSTYAAWAFSRSWGQLYTGTPKGNRLLDREYRSFEKRHAALYDNPKKLSDLSFYFSEMTRDYTSPGAPRKYMKVFMSYMEAAYVSGLLSDMVFCRDSMEELCKRPVIAAVDIIMLGKDELNKLARYVKKGGRLIIIGEFGTKNTDISKRTADEAVAALGMTARADNARYGGTARLCYNGQSVTFEKVTAEHSILANGCTPVLLGETGQVLGVSERVGDGEIIWLPCDIGGNDFQPAIWQNPQAPETDAYASAVRSLRKNGGRLLSSFIDNRYISIDAAGDVIGTLYETEAGLAMHLVNAADMLPKEDCKVLSTDIIPQFTQDAAKLDAFSLEVRLPGISAVKEIRLYSPEFEGERIPDFTRDKDKLSVQIPGNLFSGYLLVHIEAQDTGL